MISFYADSSQQPEKNFILRSYKGTTKNLFSFMKSKDGILRFTQNDDIVGLKIFLASLLFSIFFTGCFHSPKSITNETMSPEEIHSALLQNVSSIKTFSASGTISVESPSIAQSVGFELSSRGLDSIRIILEGPFGITAGAGLFSRATFKVYNALNNTIYQGSSQKQLAGFPIISNIPVDVIISAMNGMQYIPSFAEPDSFAMNEGMYRLVFVRDDGSKDVYGFDASSQRIQRYDHFDAEGNLLWKLRYRYTKDENSQWIPETVGIIIPSKEIMLTIEYSEAKYNIAVPDYSIETPNDAETVTIE